MRSISIFAPALIALALALSGCSSESAAEKAERRKQAQCNSRVDASVMAEHFVEQRLKSPSTAKFGPYKDMVIAPTDAKCEFLVVSYVDAQNSFGGTVRNNFSAVVQYVPATDKWRLVSLEM